MLRDRPVIVEDLLQVLREWQRECEQLPHRVAHPALYDQHDPLATKFKRIADELEVGGAASDLLR